MKGTSNGYRYSLARAALALILSVVVCFTFMPTYAFADVDAGNESALPAEQGEDLEGNQSNDSGQVTDDVNVAGKGTNADQISGNGNEDDILAAGDDVSNVNSGVEGESSGTDDATGDDNTSPETSWDIGVEETTEIYFSDEDTTLLLDPQVANEEEVPLTYQWYQYDDAQEDYIAIDDATSKTLEVPAGEGSYMVTITDDADYSVSAYFDLIYDEGQSGEVTEDIWWTTDSDVNVITDGEKDVELSVTDLIEYGTDENGNPYEPYLTYEWFKKDADGDYTQIMIDGAPASDPTITVGPEVADYKCTISNDTGDTIESLDVLFHVTEVAIDIVFADDSTEFHLTEGVGGGWSGGSNDDAYFVYNYPEFNEGDQLIVTDADGEKVYQWGWCEAAYGSHVFCNIDDPSDFIYYNHGGENSLDVYSNQSDFNRWVVDMPEDADYHFDFMYKGATVSVPVVIDENPVESIEFERNGASEFVLTEGADAEIINEGTDDEYYDYYCSFKQGDTLTANLKDGSSINYIFNAWNYEFINAGNNEDSFNAGDLYKETNQSDDHHWVVDQPEGDEYTVTLKWQGKTVEVPARVVANPLDSIDYYFANGLVLTEGVDSHTNYYGDGNYYDEYYVGCSNGDVLTLYFTDTETGEASSESYVYSSDDSGYVSDSGNIINYNDVSITNNQSYEKPWLPNNSEDDGYIVTVSYMGRSIELPVTIRENPVTGLIFTKAIGDSFEIVENTNGEYFENDVERYYYYNRPSFEEGDKLTIIEDDESKTYVWSQVEDEEGHGYYTHAFVCGDDQLGYEDLSYHDSQYSNHWTPGKRNYFTLGYKGVTSNPIYVNIVKDPVASLEFEPVGGSREITMRTGGSWEPDDEDNEYFHYDFPYFQYGDKLTVTYDNGSSKVFEYTYDKYEEGSYFKCGDETFDYEDYDYDSDQAIDHWTKPGETYNFNVTIRGHEFSYPVTLVESGITGIEFSREGGTEGDDGVMRYDIEAFSSGYWDSDYGEEEETGEKYFVYSWSFEPGDQITVKTADGDKIYTATDRYGSLRFEANDDPRDFFNEYDIDVSRVSGEDEWQVNEDHSFIISYLGAETEIGVHITPSRTKSISFSREDESDPVDAYSWSPRPRFKDGDKFTVTYTDDTTEDFFYDPDYDDESVSFVNNSGELIRLIFDKNDDVEWAAGAEGCYFTASLGGASCTIPVNILMDSSDIEEEIDSIEFTLGNSEARVLTEGVDSYDYIYRGTLIHEYNEPVLMTGDTLTFNFKDGTSSEYVYDEDARAFVNGDEAISRDVLDFDSDQSEYYDIFWGPGDHEFTIKYNGIAAKGAIPVTVVAGKARSISFTPASAWTVVEGKDGQWEHESDGSTYWDYSTPSFRTGDVLTVKLEGSSSVDYTYRVVSENAALFESEDGDIIYPDELEIDSNQYDGDATWTPGTKDAECTIEYRGATCEVPVTILSAEEAEGRFEYFETVPATCEKAGTLSYWKDPVTGKCYSDPEGQNELSSIVDPTLGHNKVDVAEIAPTCTMDGMKAHRMCTNCGKYYDLETGNEVNYRSLIIKASGHEWGTPVYTPNRNEAGEVVSIRGVSTCTHGCGQVLTETAAVNVVNTTSTCEKAGSTLYKTVPFRNDVFSEGWSDTVSTPALGHNWGEPQFDWSDDNSSVTATSTCINDASHVVTETRTVVKSAHSDATCSKPGYDTYTATFTNELFGTQTNKVETDAALGHEWGEATYEWTEDNGMVTGTNTCSRCGNPASQTVSVTPTDIEATCTEPAKTVYTANFRGSVFEDQSKEVVTGETPVGHHWELSYVISEPTCSKEGEAEYWCTNCGETKIEKTPATNAHTLSLVDREDSTCHEAGHEAYYECEECGKLFSDEEGKTEIEEPVVIKKKDHTWDEGEVTTTATCTEKGVITYTCSACGDTRTEETDYAPHQLIKVEAKEATEEEPGNIEHYKCSECGHLFLDADGQIETTAEAVMLPFDGVSRRGTDVSEASSGNVLVLYNGEFIYKSKEDILGRINEIRLEACNAGNVPNPSQPDHMLTASDYVPIKWSSDLEWIAQTRAAEGAMNWGHNRPNGSTFEQWYSVVTHNGVNSWGEVLASNSEIISGINNWYGEKADWVNQTPDAVTGHYTQMIDPSNLYVGIGGFIGSNKRSAIAGEFSFESDLDETQNGARGEYNQVVEVQASKLSITADSPVSIHVGGTASLALDASVTYGSRTSSVKLLGSTSWSSQNTDVATVDSMGNVVALSPGTTQITATYDGTDYTFDVTVEDHKWDEGEETTAPTCEEQGVKTFTCSECDRTKTEPISALGHDPKHVDAKDPTYSSTGNIEHWVCQREVCGKLFADEDCTTELTEDEVVVPVKDATEIKAEIETILTGAEQAANTAKTAAETAAAKVAELQTAAADADTAAETAASTLKNQDIENATSAVNSAEYIRTEAAQAIQAASAAKEAADSAVAQALAQIQAAAAEGLSVDEYTERANTAGAMANAAGAATSKAASDKEPADAVVDSASNKAAGAAADKAVLVKAANDAAAEAEEASADAADKADDADNAVSDYADAAEAAKNAVNTAMTDLTPEAIDNAIAAMALSDELKAEADKAVADATAAQEAADKAIQTAKEKVDAAGGADEVPDASSKVEQASTTVKDASRVMEEVSDTMDKADADAKEASDNGGSDLNHAKELVLNAKSKAADADTAAQEAASKAQIAEDAVTALKNAADAATEAANTAANTLDAQDIADAKTAAEEAKEKQTAAQSAIDAAKAAKTAADQAVADAEQAIADAGNLNTGEAASVTANAKSQAAGAGTKTDKAETDKAPLDQQVNDASAKADKAETDRETVEDANKAAAEAKRAAETAAGKANDAAAAIAAYNTAAQAAKEKAEQAAKSLSDEDIQAAKDAANDAATAKTTAENAMKEATDAATEAEQKLKTAREKIDAAIEVAGEDIVSVAVADANTAQTTNNDTATANSTNAQNKSVADTANTDAQTTITQAENDKVIHDQAVSDANDAAAEAKTAAKTAAGKANDAAAAVTAYNTAAQTAKEKAEQAAKSLSEEDIQAAKDAADDAATAKTTAENAMKEAADAATEAKQKLNTAREKIATAGADSVPDAVTDANTADTTNTSTAATNSANTQAKGTADSASETAAGSLSTAQTNKGLVHTASDMAAEASQLATAAENAVTALQQAAENAAEAANKAADNPTAENIAAAKEAAEAAKEKQSAAEAAIKAAEEAKEAADNAVNAAKDAITKSGATPAPEVAGKMATAESNAKDADTAVKGAKSDKANYDKDIQASDDKLSQAEADKAAADKAVSDQKAAEAAKAAAAKAEADRKAAEYAANGNAIIDPTLPKVKLKSVKKAKKSFTAKWKKLSKKQQKKVKGIEIEYSLTPDFQNPLFKTAGKKKTSVKIKKLQSKKTYYVRSHTYVIRNGQKYVSYWSTAKKVKVK